MPGIIFMIWRKVLYHKKAPPDANSRKKVSNLFDKIKSKFDVSYLLDKIKSKSYDIGKGGESYGKKRVLFNQNTKILSYGFD